MKMSKTNITVVFFPCPKDLTKKIRFLGQKVCAVACLQIDTLENEYKAHPFRVSGILPSTYHQGSV